MKYIITLLFLSLHVNMLIAQDFVREKDRKDGHPLLRGKLTFNDLLKETTCNWLYEGAQAYNPQTEAINTLNQICKDYRFVVFIGTWCEDTQELLPKLYKTILDAGIAKESIEMYGVNRNKKALKQEEDVYKIERVPTIIVLHQKREIGRITETVKNSIEEDLVQIIKPDYDEREKARIKKWGN